MSYQKVTPQIATESLLLLMRGFHHRDTETQRFHREEKNSVKPLSSLCLCGESVA